MRDLEFFGMIDWISFCGFGGLLFESGTQGYRAIVTTTARTLELAQLGSLYSYQGQIETGL